MRESKFQSQVKKRYEQEGCVALKLNPSSDIPKGFPDLLVLGPGGWTLFVETKAEDGIVEPAQQHWHDRLRSLGHKVVVVRPEAT